MTDIWDTPGVTTIRSDQIKPAPLLFVQEAHMITPGFGNYVGDPWCLSCGARVAPRGVGVHTRFHGWQADNYRIATRDELMAEGVVL